MTTIVRMLAAFAACLVVVGCTTTTTAEMLAKPGGPYGPSAGPDFGLVRYLADGSASDVAAREQDAKRQKGSGLVLCVPHPANQRWITLIIRNA